MTNDNQTIGRRPFLKGTGMTVAALGGLASPVAAKKGGKTKLTDPEADLLIYGSTDGTDFNYPDYPVIPLHDDKDGGDFDFSRIEMTPNGGTLHNYWLLFGGAVMATDPKPYVLVHLGDGLFESRGQVMHFEAREEVFPPAPPITNLAGERWRAVATERAQLGTKSNGRPDPEDPQWGVTRIDFYEHESQEYALSLLYLIGADTSPHPADGIPVAAHAYAQQLLAGGRLNPGGQ